MFFFYAIFTGFILHEELEILHVSFVHNFILRALFLLCICNLYGLYTLYKELEIPDISFVHNFLLQSLFLYAIMQSSRASCFTGKLNSWYFFCTQVFFAVIIFICNLAIFTGFILHQELEILDISSNFPAMPIFLWFLWTFGTPLTSIYSILTDKNVWDGSNQVQWRFRAAVAICTVFVCKMKSALESSFFQLCPSFFDFCDPWAPPLTSINSILKDKNVWDGSNQVQ